MSLLNSYIEKKTKILLTEDHKKIIQQFLEGLSVEEISALSLEKALQIPLWQLDLFETLRREFLFLEKKREKIIADLENQDIDQKKEFISKIRGIIDFKVLEDEYRPFKRRRKTRSTLAREAGLSEFSDWIWNVGIGNLELDDSESLEVKAKNYIQPTLGFVTYNIVLKGAQDIIVDYWIKKSELRKKLNELYLKKSILRVEKTDKFDAQGRYSQLVKFREPLTHLFESRNFYKFPPVKKSWEEGQIKVFFEVHSSEVIEEVKNSLMKSKKTNACTEFLVQALQKAVDVHVIPSITQAILEDLMEVSENEAIKRLKIDYQKVLLSPSFGKESILSIFQRQSDEFDVALVTGSGELVSTTSVSLKDKNAYQDFLKLLKETTRQISLKAIGIGLNEYTRKAELFIRQVMELDQPKMTIPVVFIDSRGLDSFVNKAFSEDPKRTKIEHTLLSLGRRLQDPLFELCKYPPRILLDIPYYVTDERLQPELKKVLGLSICSVGVDMNTAPREALVCVPRLSKGDVKNLIRFRTENSRFVEKIQLRTELTLSEADFSVASRFLKINIARSLADQSCISGKDISGVKDMIREVDFSNGWSQDLEQRIQKSKWKDIFGKEKLSFILSELKSPYKDPRRKYKVFGFSKNLKTRKDLRIGSVYPALVTRFSNFGAFINMGINQDGLIHLSELSKEYISDPRKSVSLGQWLYVKVIDLKDDAKLIFLSKIQAEKYGKQGENSRAQSKRQELKETSSRQSRSSSHKDSKSSHLDQGETLKKSHKKFSSKNQDFSQGNRKKAGVRPSRKPARAPFNNQFSVLSDLNIKNKD